jgi:hypothetical protein
VKNFDFDFKLNPRIIDDSDLKYDLIIKCELIDMFLELKKERD